MKLTLHLPGYLTPSPNLTRWSSWKVAYSEKRKAARALLSALSAVQPDSSTLTTSTEASNHSLIVAAQQNLSLTMIVNRSGWLSHNHASKPVKNMKQSSL